MKTYIYVLKCPTTGAVRYVGKCHDMKARLRQHNSEARLGEIKSHKCDWIRSVLNRGLKPVMCIDVEIQSGEDWKAIEVARIAHYRSIGCDLTNGTNGGDEPGWLTEEGRRVLSARASKTFGSEEGRVRQSELMRNLCSSEEWKAARTAAAKATRSTPEYKARMSARAKARWAEPGYREKFKASRAVLCQNEEFRKRLSEAVTKSQADPEFRAKKSQIMRAAWVGRRARAAA